ncbi:hypothetical protein FVEN_g9716 [Fusarium venenatum]|uniref:Uncharacterized protein n=1 Tax=Fusarium venenatum TaxID=56646 RepID=A0A2L2U008_9HYPO|nr:uncharacterized protein FVRRES_10983 [Fusarium venenatum]KAG8352238.1 hypothetical protein FVEN_g9716 [Fusarium venenatum]KAH6967548.1 hypothetical protein EDB82DRAFT_569948 [Fusarium venenatum]CEI70906.1 unnamed protein product [Fusarium venenatum]
MLQTTSYFIKSSIPFYHNAVKSLIFKCAELLMGIFVYKLFSLIAARLNKFTSYLMLTEDYIQRTLYISSRGVSSAGLVVLGFSLLNILLSLYGTLLWALDAPGYISRVSNATAIDYQDQRNENPPYIIQLSLNSTQLNSTERKLPQMIGSDLFLPELNYTLTGLVTNSHGMPEVIPYPRSNSTGARIWLDTEGFSVSPDSYVMYPEKQTLDGHNYTFDIAYLDGSAVWNSTFSNVFALDFVKMVAGKPEVHWDDESDKKFDSRYIDPNKEDNIWFSFGAGGGSALLKQVFTVTKGRKRHTFIDSTLKVTMLTTPGVFFTDREVTDLVGRAWSTDAPDKSAPLIGQITKSIINAQNQGMSYHFGGNMLHNGNKSAIQHHWGYYTVVNNNETLYSLISITDTNITLIRSETISMTPEPFEFCERTNSQNEAFGGRLMRIDCPGNIESANPKFFGQVDTTAILVGHGLGDSRSNISSESLNNDALKWSRNNSETIESLLIARAYTVSIDPSLVQITVDKLIVAISYLQLALSCLALLMAIVLWLTHFILIDTHWASSPLANLIYTTSDMSSTKPRYIAGDPRITLQSVGKKKLLAVDGKIVTLNSLADTQVEPLASPAAYRDSTKDHTNVGGYPID